MSKPPSFAIDSELQEGTAHVKPSGELDLATAPQLEAAVQAVLGDAVEHVVIDLANITFIDSSGLRSLIVLNDRSGAEGWRLSLISPSSQARSIFQITGAEESLPFIDDPGAGAKEET